MTNNRIAEIYKILEDRGEVSVHELEEIFNVSSSSIRRDLREMEDRHMVIKFYGGVKIDDSQIQEKSLSVRNLYDNEIKKKLAKFAASLVKDGDTVFIDAGSTTPLVMDYLHAKDILVVTQSVSVLEKALYSNIQCLVLKGYLKKNTGIIISSETIDEIHKMKFDISFLGGNSIHPVHGFSASEAMEGALKKAIIKISVRSFVIADSSKVNKITIPKFADLEECNLITDKIIDGFDYSRIPLVYFYNKSNFYKYKNK